MGFFDSKLWNITNEILDVTSEIGDALYDEVSKEVTKRSRKAKKFWDENKDEIYDSIETTIELGSKCVGKAYDAIKDFTISVYKEIVDLFFIQQEARKRCPNALRAQILSKKNNAVNVGIFNEKGVIDTRMNIVSEYGFATDIYSGMTVSLSV